mmetsp:Transcript_28950/g.72671  ORF Transcript_28950/g.72671 Transcript_28950/m.72671 type:complete len:223 (+) Transcript_28950:1197-1865(+)
MRSRSCSFSSESMRAGSRAGMVCWKALDKASSFARQICCSCSTRACAAAALSTTLGAAGPGLVRLRRPRPAGSGFSSGGSAARSTTTGGAAGGRRSSWERRSRMARALSMRSGVSALTLKSVSQRKPEPSIVERLASSSKSRATNSDTAGSSEHGATPPPPRARLDGERRTPTTWGARAESSMLLYQPGVCRKAWRASNSQLVFLRYHFLKSEIASVFEACR